LRCGSSVYREKSQARTTAIILAREKNGFLDKPVTYDEFVLVLKGELILSDNDGNSATCEKGDMFVVPKGFVGAWEMTEEYREFIVINAVTCNVE
jgi:uncharacterized cupin superfamily protein